MTPRRGYQLWALRCVALVTQPRNRIPRSSSFRNGCTALYFTRVILRCFVSLSVSCNSVLVLPLLHLIPRLKIVRSHVQSKTGSDSLLQICFWQPVSSTHPRDPGYNLSALEIHSFKRADRSFRSSTVWACCDRRMLLRGTCQVPRNNIVLVQEQTRESLDAPHKSCNQV